MGGQCKLAAAVSQTLALAAQQGQRVLQEAETFSTEVAAFRGEFKAHALFGHECGTEDSYTQIDTWMAQLGEFEARATRCARVSTL